MLWSVLSALALALSAPWLVRFRPAESGWILAILPAGLTVFFLGQVGRVSVGPPVVESTPWVPQLGIHLSFYLDGLSLLFALLITGVGALIVIYAGRYLDGDPQLGRFYLYLISFMAAMLGLVLAGNLITLFIFWELTSITSYFLIGFRHREEVARAAALQALLVTAGGGLALMAAFLLIGIAGGTFEIAVLLEQGDLLLGHSLYAPIVILVLLGCFTKSAQFPFHFWLPSAMQAPTPVSAYLHSVTMVKAGIYLLARLSPVLGGTALWEWSLLSAGAFTMLLGAVMALGQTDLKRILAYTTINALGTLVFLLGIGTETAVHAAIVFLLVHSLYKGALFLIAGIVDHETGTRDIRRLRALTKRMPLISAVASLAALSMAGIPPLFGFIGKETIYHAVLEAPVAASFLIILAVLANIFLVVAAAMMTIKPFFGRAAEGDPGSSGDHQHAHSHGVPVALSLGPILLAAAGLLVGLFPALVDARLLTPAAEAVFAEATIITLALWHGINTQLFLSALTLAGGLALYTRGDLLARGAQVGGRLALWGPDRWYRSAISALMAVARGQMRLLQHGYLPLYLLVVFVVVTALAILPLLLHGLPPLALWSGEVQLFELVIALLILAAAVTAIRSPSRLGAIVSMGVIGYGIALIFIEFGAPDLAMTQFIIETITVILFVLVVYRLPSYVDLSSRASRIRDALVAAAGGILMSVLVLAALGTGTESRLIDFFAEETYPAARGRDIVNVILVDFRAMDTLGEITVLGLAGAGVIALLRLRPRGSSGRRNS
jgi:multicomponent Na+:H+ antiporter subunit A